MYLCILCFECEFVAVKFTRPSAVILPVKKFLPRNVNNNEENLNE